jgi:muramoyltetrapeptide carboxypeptidase
MNSRRHFLRSAGVLAATSLLLPDKALAATIPAINKTIIKPPALKQGDTIAVTSPAGAVWDPVQVETFSAILKGFGFKIVLGKTLTEKFGYFAGTDELRASELNSFFADQNIKGIFCMKGGWGCARLLDKLDYNLIEKNPKVLIGFSDITTLLIAITAKTGLVTFHGPVGNSGWNAWTSESFRSVAMNSKSLPVLMNPATEEATVTVNSGKAQGELMGGNLSVISSLMGSAYLPDWKNKILFLEDVKEEPYRIDRALTQLKLCGVLDSISGFVFGKCAKCLAEEPQKAFTFHEVIMQHIKTLGIPACYGAMIGHIENKLTVPLGIRAELDADKGTIGLVENAVA